MVKDENGMTNILYVSNIAGKRMSGTTMCGTALQAARALGYNFYSVANRAKSTQDDIKKDEEKFGVKLLHIDLRRNPFSVQNIKAYKQLCNIIRDNKIDYIHCNTPTGGLLGRLAGKKCKVKKVIYQAHGFHFYKGAPIINWLFYYPVEKWLARYTDGLITINREDFELAKSEFKLRGNGKVYYVPGVGIDIREYATKNQDDIKRRKRNELGLSDENFVLLSAGDLNDNKNNRVVIEALAKLCNSNIHYCLCGNGDKKTELEQLAVSLGVGEQVHFLGFRSDVKELLCMADAFVMPSFREGLSRSLMEAMASGLPCVISSIRGNTDLIEDGKGGFLCAPTDVHAFAEAIETLAKNLNLRTSMREENLIKIKAFSAPVVTEEIKKIYSELTEGM